MTWKEHDDQKTWDLATEREKTLNRVIQQEVTARVQDRVDAKHHFEKLSQQVAGLKAQVLENKVENTELKVQLASLARLNENQAAIERFPAASSSSRMVRPEENPRVTRQTLDFSFPTFSKGMARGSVQPKMPVSQPGVPVESPIATHWPAEKRSMVA